MSRQLQTIKQLQRELDTPKHKVRFTLDGNGSVNFLDLSNLGMETRHLEMVNNFPDLIVLWAKNNNIDKIRGIDITIVTISKSREGTIELLKELNFPINPKTN